MMIIRILDGLITDLKVTEHFDEPVTYIAHRATIKGLTITGSNVSIVGGNIEAIDGSDGVAVRGYAVNLRGAKNIRLSGLTIRNADRGIVVDNCDGLIIDSCDFSVRQDGIIANRGQNYQFTSNRFHGFYPRPTTCRIGDEVQTGLSRRDCEALGGRWTDGDHSDAIQVRNGIKNLVIAGNRIEGIHQGIGQMDSTNDLPLENVIVANNDVRVTGFHSITIPRCSGLQVIGNTTQQLTGRRSPLRLDPTAIVQNNEVLSP
jgi:nitrous oxidase accessory protein NosD